MGHEREKMEERVWERERLKKKGEKEREKKIKKRMWERMNRKEEKEKKIFLLFRLYM